MGGWGVGFCRREENCLVKSSSIGNSGPGIYFPVYESLNSSFLIIFDERKGARKWW